MPYNDAERNAMLGAISATHVGVHTLTDPGTSTNAQAGEASGGSYARQACALAAASAAQRANSGTITIPVPAGTYGFLTFWNASTGNSGNYRGYAPMGGASAIKGFGTVDATLANDTIFSRAHGLADGDRLMVFNVFAETLPTGLAESTIYYVVNSTTDSFKVSTTAGGSAVDITALGGGELFWQRVVPETFNAAGEITVAIGALVHDLTAI